ncbi:MAG: hypothetical protein VB933_01330 [Pseudomonadales bacterium]
MTEMASLEFLLNAGDFFLHYLGAIRSGANFNGRGYAGCAEVMDPLVAASNGRENIVQIPGNICAIGVQVRL